jgi:hypothetical protein
VRQGQLLVEAVITGCALPPWIARINRAMTGLFESLQSKTKSQNETVITRLIRVI